MGARRRRGGRITAGLTAASLALAVACVVGGRLVPAPAGVLFLVGCAGPGTLEWRDPGDGVLVHGTAGGAELVALSVAPRSSLAAVADRGADAVSVYDLAQRTPPSVVALEAGARPSDVIAHRSHAALVACPGVDAVLEVQLRALRVSRRIVTAAAAPRSLALEAMFATRYVAHGGGEVSTYDLGSDQARLVGTAPGPLHGIAFAADEEALWLAGEGGLFVLDLASAELAEIPGARDPLLRVAVDPAGRHVAALGRDHLLIVSAPERRMLRPVPLHDAPPGEHEPALALDFRGEFALVALPQLDQVAAVDLMRGRVTARFPVGERPTVVAWIREPRPDPFLPRLRTP